MDAEAIKVCEHMQPRSYRKFSFGDLFETQRCNACGGKFSVPLKQQYLVFFLSIAISCVMAWVATYCTDIPSRMVRFLSALAVMVVWAWSTHSLAYHAYIRAFERARAAMVKPL